MHSHEHTGLSGNELFPVCVKCILYMNEGSTPLHACSSIKTTLILSSPCLTIKGSFFLTRIELCNPKIFGVTYYRFSLAKGALKTQEKPTNTILLSSFLHHQLSLPHISTIPALPPPLPPRHHNLYHYHRLHHNNHHHQLL